LLVGIFVAFGLYGGYNCFRNFPIFLLVFKKFVVCDIRNL